MERSSRFYNLKTYNWSRCTIINLLQQKMQKYSETFLKINYYKNNFFVFFVARRKLSPLRTQWDTVKENMSICCWDIVNLCLKNCSLFAITQTRICQNIGLIELSDQKFDDFETKSFQKTLVWLVLTKLSLTGSYEL